MGRIGLPELVVIFVIVLLIFGPRKLPDLARGIGQAIRGFKEAAEDGEDHPQAKPPAAGDHNTDRTKA
ncbi:MAG: twin-arginine translocase TatA/TatE family subunit [Acidobacteria bacterium]|nr:MAG: twin-arginine translocase TatA/TatE family subunit [Acidobacteriota bacterium]